MPTQVKSLRRPLRIGGLILAVGLAVAGAARSEADAPGRWKIGKPHRLKVTHTTRVKVPEGTARLRIWQAKPLDRSFPGLKMPLAVEKATLSPAGSKELATRTEGGLAWSWVVEEPAVGEAEYVSTFEVLSADRELETSGLRIRWADLPSDSAEILKGLPPLPIANERLREAVAKIKKKGKDVIDGLTAFAQWVSQNIAYTPGASCGTEDLEGILKGGGGHCGHRATVYLALCQAAGVPARRVVGYALLNHPRSGGAAEDTNRHVWVEVNLPNLGWVEVEPAPHGSAFAIGYLFVMCPRDLQSRFVAAVPKSGAETSPIVADTIVMEEVR